MITAPATDVVRATLPVVADAIEDITTTFYRRMFRAHPELERDLFNRGNQAQGDQQRALAGAVAAYATLLVTDNAPDIDDVLARVANKHASLGITADQYPIVHEHLLGAIAEVLGSACTAEVAAAWDEVYWDMAEALIGRERVLYARFDVEPGQVWQQLVVRRRTQESPDTVSFVLSRPDGATLPRARPGQYISVAVRLADGARQIRQYSLTRAPERTSWGITVKVVPEGVVDGVSVPAGQVSGFLAQNVFEGDELSCSLPYGDLVLEDRSDPLLLVSAGIGCTPIIGMLHYLVGIRTDRDVTVLHADRSPARHAHRRELADLVDRLDSGRLYHWYEDLGVRSEDETTHEGLIDLADVPVPTDARAYLCGPLPFMEVVRGELMSRDLTADRINYEVFGPDTWVPVA